MTVEECLGLLSKPFIEDFVELREVYVNADTEIVGVAFGVKRTNAEYVFTVSTNELTGTALMKAKSSEIFAFPHTEVVMKKDDFYGYTQVFRLSDCLEKRDSNFDWDTSEKRTEFDYISGMKFNKTSAIALDYVPNIINAVTSN